MIKIDKKSSLPIYRQIINSITDAIERRVLRHDDKLPSVNEICKEFGLSRDTVLVAFSELKTYGLIYSIPGKGLYVKSTQTNVKHKVFLLFDELNAFKEDLYSSFVDSMGVDANIDIFFHHFNRKVFNSLIIDNARKFTSYVIMPAMFDNILGVLSKLPQERVFILDQMRDELRGLYPCVYQNFEFDIYNGLKSGEDLISKYDRLVLVHPGGKEPKGIENGFVRFCDEMGFRYDIISNPFGRLVSVGEAYIILDDRHLVYLVKEVSGMNLAIGKDVGLMSYNDTPLKEVVVGGITTISTNFREMGSRLANLILNRANVEIENSSALIRRASL